MNPPDLSMFPQALQLKLLEGLVLLKLAGQAYSAIRTGGGLKRIFMSLWCSENVPKPIANDYKAELSKPPFPLNKS